MKILQIIFWMLVALSVTFTGILIFKTLVRADSTNIDATNHWAWSDISGWWDFYDSGNVYVGTSTLTGWASSSIGEIVLNCATTPSGNVCDTEDFKVTNPSGGGELAGCAWNDSIGWIGFSCKDGNCDGSLTPDSSSTCAEGGNWGVTIDSSGVFTGHAWNDIEGYISFYSTSSYSVETTWRSGRLTGYLESATIDTQIVGGATLNSITWYGTKPSGTLVDFQVAASNCSNGENNPPTCSTGSWSFKGPGGDTGLYYGADCPSAATGNSTPGTPICIDQTQVTNYRYLRYKVRLQSDTAQSSTPTISDIILNWTL